ncbi:hypothetical protein SETIT_1G223100v2 [Setaria italica]|uniref:Reverse transcriptase zinc-binding domain-containing protein n=1 Tax=Setaria italica TaxID=4555 RepID=A0A368PND6_SETIT|nr:hypothetical protein SETIT_1G223100v2 [Setaria italica]
MDLRRRTNAGFVINETSDHILVHCAYAKETWWVAASVMNCNCSFSDEEISLRDWWTKLTKLQPRERRKGLNILFMLVIWSIWKERNARLFNQCSSTTQELLQRIKSDIDLWVMAGARRLGHLKFEERE